MPSYDLVCEECGHKFTAFCSISDKAKQTCPHCESNKISQRFTSVNIGGAGSKTSNTCSTRSGFG